MIAFDRIVSLIARNLPPGHPDPSGVARSVLGLMSGTLLLARLATDTDESALILDDARSAALMLCGIKLKGQEDALLD